RRRGRASHSRSGGTVRLRVVDGDAFGAARGDARPATASERRKADMTRAAWVLAVLLSHWRRHPMQLATLLVGLIAATALWSGVQALNAQARLSYDRAAAAFGGGRVPTLTPAQSDTVPQSLFAELRRAGWPVSPVLEGRISVQGRGLRLIGIEPLTLPRDGGPAPRVGAADLAAFLLPPGRTLVAQATLRDLGARAG